MASGSLTSIDGVECYRIDHVEHMEPFLMNVVSSTDLWMFVSSRGTLTAGRGDADRAFLPYETDDRIHRGVGIAGPVTVIARTLEQRRELWRPFGTELDPGARRSVAKAVLGDRVIFEEHNDDWGMSFRATWMPAPDFGWVRRVELSELGGSTAEVEVLDGLLDVMPSGIDVGTEQLFSNLADAYKRSEAGPWDTAAIFSLEALVSDRAEPAEALSATVIWSFGEGLAELHLDENVLSAMVAGRDFPASPLVTGRRGSYLRRGFLTLEPHETVAWSLVADAGLNHAETLDRTALASNPRAEAIVDQDVEAGSDRLIALIRAADGIQRTADPIADAHHLSNVLFNAMRGGLFPQGCLVPIAGLLDHLERWNKDVSHRCADEVAALGDHVEAGELITTAIRLGDPDLVRLVLEYLPLAFSRRHGDPSRPWNRFSIQVRDAHGQERQGYEGNWRDIFQNWEALLVSYPAFLPHAVAKFVNASTIDGYNPYRITQDGIDWEEPDPDDPWSNIGYWGDHQITYLHRLIEQWERHDPGAIASWLDFAVFGYADVPYTIADYASVVEDPRNTISFDTDRAASVADRVGRIGADGRLMVDGEAHILRAGLLEKLIVPILGKMTNLVPGGGIWMNTQRPEWNDANNALAGYGLSMVTLYHLHGFTTLLESIIDEHLHEATAVTRSVSEWLYDITDALERFSGSDCHVDNRRRRELMDALGQIGDQYRKSSRTALGGTPAAVPVTSLKRLLSVALVHLERSIEAARRPDGLYDSYNLISFPSDEEAAVEPLGPMLEGQVAVLSSGTLDAGQSLEVLEALYASAMYRSDQHTFMLYPWRELPAFLDRNTLEPDIIGGGVGELLDARILVRDRIGLLHFAPDVVNGAALRSALDATALDGVQRAPVFAAYESVFGHHAYTGRSGSMYGYEGIGSVYWHMVGKLLLAVQETHWRALDGDEAVDAVASLADGYRRVRSGLGFRKEPAEFGAIPTDCYSHTPAHAGAQQPGMTGQVKEQILTRYGEMGVRIRDGRIALSPGLLEPAELVGPAEMESQFSYCGIPFELRWGDHDRYQVSRSNRWEPAEPGLVLPRDVSKEVFARSGAVDAVRFTMSGHGR